MTTTPARTVLNTDRQAQLIRSHGNPSVDLRTIIPDPSALAKVPIRTARQYGILPVAFDDSEKRLTLVVARSIDPSAIQEAIVKLDSGIRIDYLRSSLEDIERAIEAFYQCDLSIPGILWELEQGEAGESDAALRDGDLRHPVVRLVNAILADAVRRGASTIHLEPEPDYARVRYRIDGVLQQVIMLRRADWRDIVSRLKTMSAIDVNNAGAAQEGRISMTIAARRFDVCVTCYQSMQGENIVLRLKERQRSTVALERLDLRPRDLATSQLMMARPEGIIVVSGPTGSGKTTTLYSMLNYRNDESVNILTCEDTVQFAVPMIRQWSLQSDSQPGFASIAQSILCLDPDAILVGEMQDRAKAEMAFRIAAAGYQVYASMCARSALDVVARLIEFGLKPQLLGRSISGIVAQRLVRRLCGQCKQAYVPDETECRILGIHPAPSSILYRERGCEECDFRGYSGQIGVFECLYVDDEIGELVSRGATYKELRDSAQKSGFEELIEHAIRRVVDGVTSLPEISRVVDLTARLRQPGKSAIWNDAPPKSG